MSPKSKFPLCSLSATKSIGKLLTFYRRGLSQKVRSYYKPSRPPSPAQLEQRQIIKARVKAWQALSDEDKASWDSQATALGPLWSGYTFFMRSAVMKFLDLTDTPSSFLGKALKLLRVKPSEDSLEFGANISDLEDVDSISEQGGKYAKVKAGHDGIEWAAATDNAAKQGPPLIFDSKFDDLALGDIDGKGAYSLWGTWVNGSGAGCTAEIVVDQGGGKMLRLDDQHAVNVCLATLTMTPGLSAEVLAGIIEWKMKVNVLEAGSRGYFRIRDKDIAATGQGGFFRGDSNDIWYRSSGNVSGSLVNVVVDTWYTVRTFFDRLANYSVWWVDGAFEQNRIAMNAGDKFDILELATWLHSGCVFDIKHVKAWSLNYVQ